MKLVCTNDEWLDKLKDLTSVRNAAGTVGYVVYHNYNTILNAIQDYINKRNAVIAKYGTPNESGGYDIENQDAIIKANEELGGIPMLKLHLDIVMVPETMLKDCNLLVTQLQRISWMIEDCSSDAVRQALGIEEEVSQEDTNDEEQSDCEYIQEDENYGEEDNENESEEET